MEMQISPEIKNLIRENLEDARFVQVFINKRTGETVRRDPMSIFELLEHNLLETCEIFFVHPDGYEAKLFWDEKLDRLFSSDCIENILTRLPKTTLMFDYHLDMMNVCRRFVLGEVTEEELARVYAKNRYSQSIAQSMRSMVAWENTGDREGHAFSRAWQDELNQQIVFLLEYLLGEKNIETAREKYGK